MRKFKNSLRPVSLKLVNEGENGILLPPTPPHTKKTNTEDIEQDGRYGTTRRETRINLHMDKGKHSLRSNIIIVVVIGRNTWCGVFL